LKALSRQLLDVDNTKFNLSELADLLLSANGLGSTVKTDGEESDPWAFLSVLNLHEQKDKPVVQALTKYILDQAAKNSSLTAIREVLNNPSNQVGLLLAERVLNFQVQLIPPMYKMLAEEMQMAVDDNEPYKFTHYIIISRTYLEIDSLLDREDSQARKKVKKSQNKASDVFYFHPEDEVIHRHALAFGSYSHDLEEAEGQSDSRRAFQEAGIKPQGHLILLEASKYPEMVSSLEQVVNGT